MINQITLLAISTYHAISRIVPRSFLLGWGKFFGRLLYFVDSRHRNIALANLHFAYDGEQSERDLKQIALNHFEQLGMTGQEWINLKGLDEKRHKDICNLITVEGEENLQAAKQKNKAVILLGAHFGNWEYAHLYYASRFNRLNFIVRKLDNPCLEDLRLEYNNKFNINILYKENGLRRAINNLKKGEDLVIFADRKASLKEGIPVDFFGQKTSTLTIVATLALKYNIPVVPMFIVRDTDTRHHRLIFLPELNVSQDKDDPSTLVKFVQMQNDTIEKIIRSHPDHWLWIHRKWKCYHREIYQRHNLN